MRILFLQRRDAITKPGGDSTKVKRYIKRLQELGFDALSSTDRTSIRDTRPDIVHLLNLDLPAENLANAREAKKYGAHVVLSTIRHPFQGVLDFYNHGEDTLYKGLKSARIPASFGISFREIVKLGKSLDRGFIGAFSNYATLQQRLIDSVDHLLPMAPGEQKSLQSDFKVNCGITIIENALSFTARAEEPRTEKNFDLVNIGRIEPRKNSLLLARLAARSPEIKMAFAGQLNFRHRAYVREFTSIVNNSPNITYFGAIPHNEVRELLRKSVSYVNPAWFEVVSQADFEAISHGIPITSTYQSYLTDFAVGAGFVSPLELAEGARGRSAEVSLEKILNLSKVANFNHPLRTWDDVGEDLALFYEKALT